MGWLGKPVALDWSLLSLATLFASRCKDMSAPGASPQKTGVLEGAGLPRAFKTNQIDIEWIAQGFTEKVFLDRCFSMRKRLGMLWVCFQALL